MRQQNQQHDDVCVVCGKYFSLLTHTRSRGRPQRVLTQVTTTSKVTKQALPFGRFFVGKSLPISTYFALKATILLFCSHFMHFTRCKLSNSAAIQVTASKIIHRAHKHRFYTTNEETYKSDKTFSFPFPNKICSEFPHRKFIHATFPDCIQSNFTLPRPQLENFVRFIHIKKMQQSLKKLSNPVWVRHTNTHTK